MIRGTAKFNGLALGELTANFIANPGGAALTAKAAFVDVTTGRTHGWTTSTGGWSLETLGKLEELRTLMEKDLAVLHFSEGQDPLETTSKGISPGISGGLSGHLGGDDAPSL